MERDVGKNREGCNQLVCIKINQVNDTCSTVCVVKPASSISSAVGQTVTAIVSLALKCHSALYSNNSNRYLGSRGLAFFLLQTVVLWAATVDFINAQFSLSCNQYQKRDPDFTQSKNCLNIQPTDKCYIQQRTNDWPGSVVFNLNISTPFATVHHARTKEKKKRIKKSLN